MECVPPIHPVMPALIEVYVNSMLIPTASKNPQDHTNEPITEKEILAVFKNCVICKFSSGDKESSPMEVDKSSPNKTWRRTKILKHKQR